MLTPWTQGIVLFKDMDAAEQSHHLSRVSVAFNGRSVSTRVKSIRRPREKLPWDVDGVIGMGIKATRNELVWPFVNASESDNLQYTYSGMDFKTGAANVKFGIATGSIVWSEPMLALEDFYYQRYTNFPMYQLSACGQSLTDTTSAYWNAVIDFHSACLTLPREFYNTLLAWTPLSFNASSNLTVVDAGVVAADIPTLHFKLSHFSPIISLPLRDLALPSNSSLLCIRRGESSKQHMTGHDDFDRENTLFSDAETDARVPNMYQTPIVLGTLALESLGLIVSANDTQLGFRTNVSFAPIVAPSVEPTCREAVHCIGHQTYRADRNTCDDPFCGKWLYHTYDPSTKTCVVSPMWQSVALVVVGVCTFYELYFDFARSRIGRRVVATQ
ncbi:hypothetical protein LEN26_009324 [Aphanomyces euteiches]|nr:hypothetical protein AeMF1_009373 [Aphanomyces euteiches]KAH9126846.1 hypothetical protein LEN26_009324 [Aphanomyces euteiches]KAH9197849.1 hypothetical protein AeNC1_000216 [Aphanomyces euteiches]